jgi:hypothetical protein
VTGDNMNYAIVFLVAILIASTAYWYIGGRKWYTGPLVEAQLVNDSDADSNNKAKLDNKDAYFNNSTI